MKKIDFKKLIPVIAAILIFVGITYIYFSPMLKGKVIYQGDMVSVQGMIKEANDFRDKFHEEPLWTNSMFGGMPAYLISIHTPGSLIVHVRTLLTLGLPAAAMLMFNYLLGFYILLRVLRVNPWLCIVGALAFAFSSYMIIIIEAGHITKALAIGYMAPVLGGVILVCRKKFLLGGTVLALFMALELYSNHVQITYYLVMFLAIYVISKFIELAKEKDYKTIGKISLVFLAAAILSFGCNTSNLLNTLDYAKHTIRGKSELSEQASNKTSGLDRDYVVQWSMGKAETMSLMIPGFKGRSSAMRVNENKKALKEVDPQMKESVGSMSQYWGDQPFTSACYAGAIVVFLFVLGLFIVRGRLKWTILIAVLLFSALSWGKHFMGLTNFFLDYLPAYNKFRAVSMMLVMVEFAVPLLAILAVDKLIRTPNIIKEKIQLKLIDKEVSVQNLFFVSFALTGGLSLLFYLMPGLTSFEGAGDAGIYDQIAKSNGAEIANRFMENVELARIALFKADAIRSFFFILLAAIFVWLFMKTKINKTILVSALGLLIMADLWMVDKQYLNEENFVSKKEAKIPFPETTADKIILQDKDPNYRVLNIAVNTFNDASTSYRHKSVGGYHAAKLRRYQDLIDHHIQREMQQIMTSFRSNPTESSINNTLSQQGILNMLNTRYIIYNPETAPLTNQFAYGNAWFVNEFQFVENPDEEIEAIDDVDLNAVAIVDERFKEEVEGFVKTQDTTAIIQLDEYKPNHLTYSSSTQTEQLAVFSEIYYEDGWNAYIDGELKPHFRVDYVLRAMLIPEGNHKIEFKFEPSKYFVRDKISLLASIVLFIAIGFSIFLMFKKGK